MRASEAWFKEMAQSVIAAEIIALQALQDIIIGDQFQGLSQEIADMNGKCIVTGVGKSAIAARKIAATLATIGVQAMFLDPIGMFHGELGLVRLDDIVIMVSQSGETDELLRLVPPLIAIGAYIVPIVAVEDSSLGRMTGALVTGCVNDPYFKVPTASSIAAVALGDALAIVVGERQGFSDRSLAVTHPGGTIGRVVSELASSATVDG